MKSTRVLKMSGIISAIIGVLILMGTAGASDNNTMSALSVTWYLIIGSMLFIGGCFLSQAFDQWR